MAKVVFYLDDLILILVNCPLFLIVKKLDDLRNMTGHDASYLLDSRNLALVLNAK